MDLKELGNTLSSFKKTAPMPVLFVGHGSPMNGIEDNRFSQSWEKLGRELPVPVAVLCISAHWLTKGTFITAMPEPKTIHDFGGFPQQLYDVEYPAPGDPLLAGKIIEMVSKVDVLADHEWGLDHGTWTVVRHMYPEAKIPVLQLSIDYYKPAAYHYELARELSELRSRGILIIGSGNIVHNLGLLAWDRLDSEYGYDWALEMNETLKKLIKTGDHKKLLDYHNLGKQARLAIPTPDHYYPLLYVLALQRDSDIPEIFNDQAVGGSLTMTSVRMG